MINYRSSEVLNCVAQRQTTKS